jgi:hypothetical protein
MRRLGLKKETLIELGSDELVHVVGASFPSKYNCTESFQVCNPLSRDACIVSLKTCVQTLRCYQTETC